MKLLTLLLGAGAGIGLLVLFSKESKASGPKGGTFSILLGSQVVIPNTDDVLNALERDFGFPLESVATRYISTTPNGTLFTVAFLPSADRPELPKAGKVGTSATGVPYKVLSVTQAPVA